MKQLRIAIIIISAITICISAICLAGLDADLAKVIREIQGKTSTKKGSDNQLTQQQAADGLKEALAIAAKNAVNSTGKLDGYFGNPLIKIAMPEKLTKVEKALRKVGLGKKVDQFVVTMNRAAEKAAPEAKEIFWDAIKSISIEDAFKILRGNDTAATEYFRSKTGGKLTDTFKPIVVKATNDTGVTRLYKEITTKAKGIPYLEVKMVDIDDYVVAKALDGLFYMVGEEEKKIRKDPLARVTDLLKLVFGNQ